MALTSPSNSPRLDIGTLPSPEGILPGVLHEDPYWPVEPTCLEDTGLSPVMLESILTQNLLAQGTQSGRKLSEQLGIPFEIVDQLLSNLRVRKIVAHSRPAPFNDYYFSLTEHGQQRTLQHQQVFKYTGVTPVPLSEYVLSIEAQANQFTPIQKPQLLAALQKISYDPTWLDLLGPAINCNGGMFIYGTPGNGKTTLAKCLSALRGEAIWIPHAIVDDGIIVKLYDPAYHVPKPLPKSHTLGNLQNYDRRWIRIERPTVVVGGELTLDNLEFRHEPRSNTCEAPVHLKSNCGSLLIDDFGRQRVAPEELLNRWIIPLENKIDFLTLPSGKKVSVPFEQIVMFSTNLKPDDLVDEAFLRRVPYKMQICDPSESEFIDLFEKNCEELGFPWRPEVIHQLINGFFKPNQMPMRRCYSRDLLNQVRAYCAYLNEPLDLRIDYLKHACRNYFGGIRTLGQGRPSRSDRPQ